MKKVKELIKKIDTVDVFLLTAFGLYMTLLISNVIKMF
jgi:hypothetical protein